MYTVRIPPPFYPSLGWEGSEKLKKGGESMVQGKVFVNGVELALSLFNVSFFKVYHFYIFTSRNYFTLCKTVFCICRKIIFFLPP